MPQSLRKAVFGPENVYDRQRCQAGPATYGGTYEMDGDRFKQTVDRARGTLWK